MNPEWEAQVLVAGLPAAKNYVVFGMGLGYHVIELLKKYPESKVTVLEKKNICCCRPFGIWTGQLISRKIVLKLYMSRI